ncbi:coenzyme A transferase [Haladaptatus paucihalophilus DX253]|uniref:Coenzyme A transferase n=1 Tax=Haladaptatus paucihalophilus DX253 TaxID=797209 RepID=E7QWC8_HALPU|nr:3-oxoadipate--succinyl-CoA transferase subunit B [Haladaptatus paucihalophilus]EFW91024.1 coenzyme A transferase [Haladaptatus paucihalophilus DX253]SHL39470.1 glutaconate CoA-transferase subunit B [Haladaptatus paucihalophilus DX253]
MSDLDYTDTELMITRAALELRNDDTVLVGVGVPNLACNLAKRTHAPDLQMIYESGTVDSNPDALPLSIGDPVLATGARSIVPMYEGFSRYLQSGRIDVGFLGGAQIDKRGNINSTVIGDYDDPKVRLPGSGGACEISSNAHRTLIITPHQKRRFPEEVDFITSPGYVEGREEMGLRGGPEAVITDKAVMKFDDNGEMYVDTLHVGVTRDEVQEATGWEVQFADDVTETPTPDDEEIRLIREKLDPDGIYTGGGD